MVKKISTLFFSLYKKSIIDLLTLYKKYYFYYYGKKVMTYTMVKKTSFKFPTERYLKIVKTGYKDCDLPQVFLKVALNTK